MEFKTIDDYKYGMIDTYLKSSMDNRYVAGIKIPLNICNLRESLARSLFITLYKPRNSYVFISLGDIYNSLLEKCAEAFDIIDDCQTIFAKSIKDVPCGVYIIGSVWIAASDLTYVGNNNFQEVDKL